LRIYEKTIPLIIYKYGKITEFNGISLYRHNTYSTTQQQQPTEESEIGANYIYYERYDTIRYNTIWCGAKRIILYMYLCIESYFV